MNNEDFYQLWDDHYENHEDVYVGTPVLWDYDEDRQEHTLWLPESAQYTLDRVPNTRKRGDHWVFPGRAEHLPWLEHIYGPALKITDAARAELRHRWPAGPPDELMEGLRPDQETDVRHALFEGGSSIFGHDTGVGKTVSAIAWMRALHVEHNPVFAVVCPPNIMGKWEEEIEKWWPEATTVLVPPTPKKDREAAFTRAFTGDHDGPVVVLLSFYSLPSLTKLTIPWPGVRLKASQKEPKLLQKLEGRIRGLVLDEAHWVKEPKNVRPMAVATFATMSDYVLPMSATIVDRASDDMWAAYNLVDPELVGSRGTFRNMFCDIQEEWHGGLVNTGYKPETVELSQQIFGPLYVRRSKRELRDKGILPARLPHNYIDVPLTKEQEEQYLQLEEKLMTKDPDGGGLLIATNGAVRDQYLRMSATGVLSIADRRVQEIAAPSNKIAALLEFMEENPEPLIIAVGKYRKVADLLARTLKAKKSKLKIAQLVGGRKQYELHAEAKGFQNGEYDHIIVQAGVGAEGIDLYRSSHVVFIVEDWSWAVNDQIIGRADRVGQTSPVNVTVFMSKGTIDYWVRETNERKMALAEVMNQDGIQWEDMTYGQVLNRPMGKRGRR